MANFTFVAFLLSRLSLIGTEHGKLVTNVSTETSMKKLFTIFLLISVLFSVVKYFVYVINDYENIDSEKYEFPLNKVSFETHRLTNLKNTNNYIARDKAFVIIAFDVVSDFVNYAVFWSINLGIEVFTLKRFKETLAKKMKTISNAAMKEKREKENTDAIERMISMVRSNAITNFILKFPVSLNSMFQIVIACLYLNNSSETNFDYNNTKMMFYSRVNNDFFYFCMQLNGCKVFDKFSNLLFFFSLSFTFFFLLRFDLNFKACFLRFSTKFKSDNKNQQLI